MKKAVFVPSLYSVCASSARWGSSSLRIMGFGTLGQMLLNVQHFSKVQCGLIQSEKWYTRWMF